MLTARRAGGDYARVTEDAELLRDGGLGHVGSADQLIDRTLAVTKCLEEMPPRWFRKELKDVGHGD